MGIVGAPTSMDNNRSTPAKLDTRVASMMHISRRMNHNGPNNAVSSNSVVGSRSPNRSNNNAVNAGTLLVGIVENVNVYNPSRIGAAGHPEEIPPPHYGTPSSADHPVPLTTLIICYSPLPERGSALTTKISLLML